jgi:hypothetical protein
MLLGTKRHGAGNTTRYDIDYSNWLMDGESLLSATVVLDPAFTATVTDITISNVAVLPSHKLHFTLAGGSANEVFTLDVQTTTQNPTEIKKDTVAFTVV